MDTWTPAELTWLRPLGLEAFAEDCLALTAELDRDLEPLHRIGEELLARIAPPTTTGSARMA